MKDKKILLIGYGSIGKRHTKNLKDIGIKSYILTKYPDDLDAIFLRNLEEIKDVNIDFCIIATPTARHLDDLKRCLTLSNIPRKILIEKPLECSYLRGEKIKDISKKYGIDIFIAYNMRFLNIFNIIKKFIKEQKDKIRIVDIVAGQDLREWRPYKDYTESYSAYRDQGGGADLDLSHEIDYILWIFGNNFKDKIIFRNKISNLKINSPDIFILMLDYNAFIVDITLDYIRSPKERYIKILCEGGKNLYYNFITNILKIGDKQVVINNDANQSYKEMIISLFDINDKNKNIFCFVDEGLSILKILEL